MGKMRLFLILSVIITASATLYAQADNNRDLTKTGVKVGLAYFFDLSLGEYDLVKMEIDNTLGMSVKSLRGVELIDDEGLNRALGIYEEKNPTSVYTDKQLDMIAEETKISHLILGDYTVDKQNVKVNIRIVKMDLDPSKRSVVASLSYKDSLANLFRILSTASYDILKILQTELKDNVLAFPREVVLKLMRNATINFLAYASYIESEPYVNARQYDKAIFKLEEALYYDPYYLDALHRYVKVYELQDNVKKAMDYAFQFLYAAFQSKWINRDDLLNIYLQVGDFYFNALNEDRALEIYDMALKYVVEGETSPRVTDKLYYAKALVYYVKRYYEGAILELNQSISIAKDSGDTSTLIKAYALKAKSEKSLDKYTDALNSIEAALSGAQSLNDRRSKAEILTVKGLIETYAFKNDVAITSLSDALKIQKDIDDKVGIINTYRTFGKFYTERLEYKEAASYFDRSVEIAMELKEKLSIPLTSHFIGMIEEEEIGSKFPPIFHDKDFMATEEIKDKLSSVADMKVLGLVHNLYGDKDNAVKSFIKGYKVVESLEDNILLAKESMELGRYYFTIGDMSTSFKYLNKAFALLKDLDPSLRAKNYTYIGAVLIIQGKIPEATLFFKRAIDIQKQMGDSGGEIESHLLISESYKMLENFEQALIEAQAALAIAERVDSDKIAEIRKWINDLELYLKKSTGPKSNN